MRKRTIHSVILAGIAIFAIGDAGAAEVATYTFNNTLAAQQAGVASLVAVDPQNQAAFGTDTVFGSTRSIYHFGGTTVPSEQGGLVLDTAGLIPNADSYSAEILLSFESGNNAWRRILDSLDRTSDAGLYIDLNNNVNIFNDGAASGTGFQTGVYYDVALTVDSSNVANVYLNGNLALTTTTTAMDIQTHFLNFFLDNNQASGQGEYSPGNVALIRIFDAPLSATEVATLARDPFAGTGTETPEPSTLLLFGAGLMGLAIKPLARHRKSRRTVADRAL